MSVVTVAVVLAVALLVLGMYFKVFAGWHRLHQGIFGGLTVLYGMWLAFCTGTVLKLVLPGIGSVVLGSAAGAGAGFLTFLAVGVVGVATGGLGVAIGALGMMGIGAILGGVGAAAGSMGLVRVPLVSPWFWAPVVLLGIYLLVGCFRKRTLLTTSQVRLGAPPPDA